MKDFKIKLSFDDGKKEDLKLVRILADYDFEDVTFYIPALSPPREISERDIINISKRFKVGGHTMSHYWTVNDKTGEQTNRLTDINPEAARQEITECRKYLMNLIGHTVDSFCYPRGAFNDDIKKMVAEAGFKDARTTRVLETEEWDDPYETPTTIHIYQRNEYNGVDWLKMAKVMFRDIKDSGGTYHLFGHSYELEKFSYWDKFIELLNYMDKNK